MSDNSHIRHYEELMSKSFDILRFPLIVGVIFIHSLAGVSNSLTPDANGWTFPIYHYFGNFFSEVIGRVAVPLFFFISGYLFFYKVDTFDSASYLYKLKRRCRTLLVPYLFWNIIAAALFMILPLIPATREFLNDNCVFSFDMESLKVLLIGKDTGEEVLYPMAYQFWFIRDLICCVIISPILYFFVRKTSWWGIALLAMLWMCDWSIPYFGRQGFSMAAIFFFSAGAWFATREVNVSYLVKDLKAILIVYPVWALADLLTKGYDYNVFIHKVGILLGMVFCFTAVAVLIERRNLKPVPFLSSASFFVFAMHDPWLLTPIQKILVRYLHPQTDIAYCAIYLSVVSLTIVLAVLIYKLLQKLSPGLISIISGNR